MPAPATLGLDSRATDRPEKRTVSQDEQVKVSSLLLVGDFRSPHACAWGEFFNTFIPNVVMLSSAPVHQASGAVEPDHFNLVVARTTRRLRGRGSDTVSGGMLHSCAVQARHGLSYVRARVLALQIKKVSRAERCEWIHALRLPWEGVAVQMAGTGLPGSLSLWGSDLVTQAPQSRLLTRMSEHTLGSVRGLTADCHRDVQLAFSHGLPSGTPTIVVPGNVGIPDGEIRSPEPSRNGMDIVCPRGILPHIRWRELIAAVSAVRRVRPEVSLTFLDVKDPPAAVEGVTFRARLSRDDMLALARMTDIVVSPGTSDGVPNSVLEFMSQGAVPVLSDLPSQRELVADGVNGFLCDPRDPDSISAALLKAASPATRPQIAARNSQMLADEYSQGRIYERLRLFFESLS